MELNQIKEIQGCYDEVITYIQNLYNKKVYVEMAYGYIEVYVDEQELAISIYVYDIYPDTVILKRIK